MPVKVSSLMNQKEQAFYDALPQNQKVHFRDAFCKHFNIAPRTFRDRLTSRVLSQAEIAFFDRFATGALAAIEQTEFVPYGVENNGSMSNELVPSERFTDWLIAKAKVKADHERMLPEVEAFFLKYGFQVKEKHQTLTASMESEQRNGRQYQFNYQPYNSLNCVFTHEGKSQSIWIAFQIQSLKDLAFLILVNAFLGNDLRRVCEEIRLDYFPLQG